MKREGCLKMNRCVNGWMDGCLKMNECVNRRMDEWMFVIGWMFGDECILSDEWIDGWMGF